MSGSSLEGGVVQNLDPGLDYMDWVMDWIMDWIMDSILDWTVN